MTYSEQTVAEMRDLMGRYPEARSALLPMLHLLQSVDGRVTTDGIELCASLLGISEAEVSGVATFYTMYKKHPVGTHHVGVCTNTLCAVLGGDADGRCSPVDASCPFVGRARVVSRALGPSSASPLSVPSAPSAVSLNRAIPSVTRRSTWGAPLSVALSPASRAWPR